MGKSSPELKPHCGFVFTLMETCFSTNKRTTIYVPFSKIGERDRELAKLDPNRRAVGKAKLGANRRAVGTLNPLRGKMKACLCRGEGKAPMTTTACPKRGLERKSD